MRFVHICLILAIANATKFLDETTVFGQEAEVQITYDQPKSLFTDDQLTQNTEFRMNKDEPFDYQSEQISPLQSVEQQQILLAYEKDLLPQGDCVILYAECQFKGTSKQVCKGAEEVMSFSLPVFSIYVPELQQFSTIDVNSNSQVTFLTSDKCIDKPIVMADTQLDFFIAKSMSNWIGESAGVTQLLQQEQVENQDTADQQVEQQSNAVEQVDQQVQQSSDVNVEQQVDQTQTEQQVDSQQEVSVQEQQSTENVQQSEQVNEDTQSSISDQQEQKNDVQSTEQNNQPENQQEQSQENTTTEQNQENETAQQDQSQEQVEQQPEVVAQNEELQEKQMEQVVETVTEIVQQVEEKQEVELESEKEQLQQEEQTQQQQSQLGTEFKFSSILYIYYLSRKYKVNQVYLINKHLYKNLKNYTIKTQIQTVIIIIINRIIC